MKENQIQFEEKPSFEGVVQRVVYRNSDNGFSVVQIESDDEDITAVGTIPFMDEGERVRLWGTFVEHSQYGRQLDVAKYDTVLPTDQVGVERYLGSGMIAGIGPATARDIVAHFGEETMDVMMYHPQRLTEISGIGKKRLAKIMESFQKQTEMRDVMIFLQGLGVSPLYSVRIYNKYGAAAKIMVQQNPYRLADEIEGIGFLTADKIGKNMNIGPDDPVRLEAGLAYTLSRALEAGHVCLPRDELIRYSAELLQVDIQPVEHALESAMVSGRVILSEIEGQELIYMPALLAAEKTTASRLLLLAEQKLAEPAAHLDKLIDAQEQRLGMQLAAEQRQAIARAMTAPLSIITGGPGTGKTTVLRFLISLLTDRSLRVLLCAPTGRAARRMTEAAGMEAKTIHRLLEYSSGDGATAFFNRSASNPLEADVVIVDECSMVDLFLMAKLLEALPENARLVLVGDANQLPPVGPGNVLKDILGSGVGESIELKEIFRQAQQSLIVLNAHRVYRGEKPELHDVKRDFFFERQDTAAQIASSVVELCATRIPGYLDVDPCDVQVLSPMKKGDAGVQNLNRLLQQALNPPAPDKKERKMGMLTFREGDKVMHIKNNYRLTWQLGDLQGEGVFNGDMGRIEAIDPEESTVQVKMDDARVVRYGFDELDQLDMAYAISVHKSQGSEFPAVILPLAAGPPMLMTRNLLYTALTRAKEMVMLVSREQTVYSMIANNRIARRYGALLFRIKEGMAP
ncbi:MAG: ATP-dependent RecD-like DNA helicase [Christensenellales bacterium]